jgi:hypothetical protein
LKKLTKLYDFTLGVLIGVGVTLLVQGHNDAALAVAALAVVLRFTADRTALEEKG